MTPRYLLLVAIAALLAAAGPAAAYTITVAAPSAFSTDVPTLNTNIGMTAAGIVFEDFDDALFVPELAITQTGGIGNVPFSANGSSRSWTPQPAYQASDFSVIEFEATGLGADIFGIGIGEQNFDDMTMSINGGASIVLTDLPNYVAFIAGGQRNGYVRVERDGGDAAIDLRGSGNRRDLLRPHRDPRHRPRAEYGPSRRPRPGRHRDWTA